MLDTGYEKKMATKHKKQAHKFIAPSIKYNCQRVNFHETQAVSKNFSTMA